MTGVHHPRLVELLVAGETLAQLNLSQQRAAGEINQLKQNRITLVAGAHRKQLKRSKPMEVGETIAQEAAGELSNSDD